MGLVERWGQRIQAEAVRLGSGHGRGISSGWLAWAAESRADLALARAYASEAFDILSPSGRMNLMLPISVSLLGDVALVTDGPDAALSALELLPRPARDPLLTNSPMWWLAHARAALAAGHPRVALADLAEVESWQRLWPADVGGTTMWHPLAAEARLALGDTDQAGVLALEGMRRARAFGADRPLARALRAAAITLPAAERRPLLDEALGLTFSEVCGVDQVRYRIDLAEAEVALGNHAVAVEHLREAIDLADRSGAGAVASEAVDLLVLHGGRPPRRRRHGAMALTPSERRVVDVALEGRRNREIAELLFLTEKTVESHLTSAYRKLGIRSRHELEQALTPYGDPAVRRGT
jgi:DNA-binding CsgD family transcriptional regulator